MRSFLVLALCCSVIFVGCRRSRPAPTIVISEPPKPPDAAAGQNSSPSTTATPPAAKSAPVNIPLLEAGVEFGDLNNMIEAYEERHKRLPTVEELKKLYYGGTRPIPIPPGYRLAIDPKTKKAKVVPGG